MASPSDDSHSDDYVPSNEDIVPSTKETHHSRGLTVMKKVTRARSKGEKLLVKYLCHLKSIYVVSFLKAYTY